jgi:hypothetical protein
MSRIESKSGRNAAAWVGLWGALLLGCSSSGDPAAAGGAGNGGTAAGAGNGTGTAGKSSGSGGNTPTGGSASTAGSSGVANAAGTSTGSGGTANGNGGVTNGGGGHAAGGAGGGASGAGPSGGAGGGGTAGGPPIFSQCRLHFGTIDSKAKENPSMIPELDFFTPGWMGLEDTFDQKYVCDEAKEGAVLGKQVPVIVAYVSAFYVKRHHGKLCDCNVNECGQTDGKANDLCHFGAKYIQQDVAAIVAVYESYAKGYAACYGTTRPIVFEMEPDWYQYTISEQEDPMTKAEAGSILAQFVAAIQKHLPNARFSIDISPWVDDNGTTNGQAWYSNFDLSKFSFANTSGGSTLAANTKIRGDNNMTWGGVSQVTGKPLLADTGYGANGVSAGHDANWDSVANLNARIDDGVVSISQYNPKADWGSTIASLRSQLKKPKFCP